MSGVLKYRPDIDGLRAVAVLSVVLYHLGVPGISGGFVGVDVFFVISGYLITTIIQREIAVGQFSYANFYLRRARRLLPALTVVGIASFLAAWFTLLPLDFKLFSESLAAAALFVANVYFWSKTDYFSDPVDTIALLHTWSLAVEEQFYVFFPPLLLLGMRYGRKALLIAIVLISLVSLVGAQYALESSPESAFYLAHWRAWELLAGALVALGALPKIGQHSLRTGLSLLGLGLILGSVVWLDKSMAFPGVAALPAVVGTALIIHADSARGSMVGRLLSWRPILFIGLISYSLYLWHWPLFAFARNYVIRPFDAGEKLGLFALAIILAALSWRYVERPFRGSGGWGGRGQVLRAGSAAVLLMVLLALPGSLSKGAIYRVPENVAGLSAVSKETIPFRRACFGAEPVLSGEMCGLGVTGGPSFLFWGDSHALALAPAVDQAAKKAGSAGRFAGKSACPPMLGMPNFMPEKSSCNDFNESVLAYIESHPTIKTVVLAARWSRYDGHRPQHNRVEASAGAFSDGLARVVDRLEGREIKVFIVMQVPEQDWDVPSLLARSHWFNHAIPAGRSLMEHHQQMAPFNVALERLKQDFIFEIVNLETVYCDSEVCSLQKGGHPLYRDTHHLSRFGAMQAADALRYMFDDGTSVVVNGSDDSLVERM